MSSSKIDRTGIQRPRAIAAAGFTLVEIVVVIVILGLLGAVAMPRFFDNHVFAERGYFEELAAALRHARAAAVATGCPVRFVLTPSTYAAEQQQPQGGRCNRADTSFGQALRLADGSNVAGAAPAGVTASPAVTLVFDALGETGLGSNRTIAVGPHSLTLQAPSGYVQTP